MLSFPKTIDEQKNEIQNRLFNLQNKIKSKGIYNASEKRYSMENPKVNQKNQTKTMKNVSFRQSTVKDIRKEIEQNNKLKQNLFPNRIPNDYDNIFNRKPQKHEQQIQNQTDLAKMLKTILQGQKFLQDQIKEIKRYYSRQNDIRTQLKQQIYDDFPISNHRNGQNQLFNNSNIQNISRTVPYSNNYSKNKIEAFLTTKERQKNQQQYEQDKKKRKMSSIAKNKTGVMRKNGIDTFEQLVNLVKLQKNLNQKLQFDQNIKNKIWKNIQNRIRQSEKQYQDSVHKNNKHQHQHLIYTNQLQKRLKEDLKTKVYSMCNQLLFK